MWRLIFVAFSVACFEGQQCTDQEALLQTTNSLIAENQKDILEERLGRHRRPRRRIRRARHRHYYYPTTTTTTSTSTSTSTTTTTSTSTSTSTTTTTSTSTSTSTTTTTSTSTSTSTTTTTSTSTSTSTTTTTSTSTSTSTTTTTSTSTSTSTTTTTSCAVITFVRFGTCSPFSPIINLPPGSTPEYCAVACSGFINETQGEFAAVGSQGIATQCNCWTSCNVVSPIPMTTTYAFDFVNCPP